MAALVLLAGLMLIFPKEIIYCAQDACALFAKAVLPGLFPFLTVTLLITSRLSSANILPIALMGLLSGSPAGARLSAYGSFTKKSYRAFAHLTGVMSPMFMLGTLPLWLGGYGEAIFIASLIGAGITAMLSWLLPMKNGQEPLKSPIENPAPLSLAGAINLGAQTMLTVCGCMVMGSCLMMLVNKLLPVNNPLYRALLQGVLEVTRGAKDISEVVFVDFRFAPSICAAMVSFGGVSLLMQNHAFYQKGALPLIPYLLLKLFHGFAAFGLCYLLAPLFEYSVQTAVVSGNELPKITLLCWSGSFLLSEIVIQWGRKKRREPLDAAPYQIKASPGRGVEQA